MSAYELERKRNIEENEKQLYNLGLAQAIEDVKPKAKQPRPKQPKLPATQPQPVRASRRLSGDTDGLVEPLNDAVLDEADGLTPRARDSLKRASTKPRLTEEQMAKLNALEPVSSAPLSEEESEAVALVAEDLANGRVPGGWRAYEGTSKSMYGDKRSLLRAAATARGLRWPTWLDKIEAALPGQWGKTQSARDQTMFGLERAAVGLGLHYGYWPEGVGVLLANEEVCFIPPPTSHPYPTVIPPPIPIPIPPPPHSHAYPVSIPGPSP